MDPPRVTSKVVTDDWASILELRCSLRYVQTCMERRRMEIWLQHKSLHAFTHMRSWSWGKIRSATNGSNTQLSMSSSKPRTPKHLCPQEIADPSTSASRMCEHTRGSGVGMSKSVRLRSATAPRTCERTITVCWAARIQALLAAPVVTMALTWSLGWLATLKQATRVPFY